MPLNADLMKLAQCPYSKKEIEKILDFGDTRTVYATCDQPLGDGERKDVWFRVSRIRTENAVLYARSLNTDVWYPVGKMEVR
jgi:hypothetical protein